MENPSHKSLCENGQKTVWPTLLKRDAPCQQDCIRACFGSTWETPSRSHEWSYCDIYIHWFNRLPRPYLSHPFKDYSLLYIFVSLVDRCSLAAIQGALSPIWNQQSSCWEACPLLL